MPIYRYRFNGIEQDELNRLVVGGTILLSGPNVEVDIDLASAADKDDLDLVMGDLGWTLLATDPNTSVPGRGATTLSADATIAVSGGCFAVDTSGGDVTITLSPVADATGEVAIKNIGPGIVTIVPDGVEEIDSQPNLELTNPMESATLCPGNGTSWWIF